MQHPDSTSKLESLICAALRGENPKWPWPQDADAPSAAALLANAEVHGVGALLHASLTSASDWPAAVVQGLRTQAMQQAIWELRHQHLLVQTLAALHDIDVQPVLIKGTALAYSLYSDPLLRTRGDTDLIVPIDAKQRVHEALLALGFERATGVSGDFVSYQANYTRQNPEGGTHTLDLHWKINNSEVLSRLFSHEELLRSATALPALGPYAVGPSLILSLLIACMHRATHKTNPYYVGGEPHHDPNRLIWLADIHLIASRLSGQEWHAVGEKAIEKGLCGVVLDSLQRTRSAWHTTPPSSAMTALPNRAPAGKASKYLGAGKLRQQWMDFCAIDGGVKKLRLLREILFPSAAYMRVKFGAPSAPLPWLYIRRAVSGLIRQIAQTRQR